MNQNTKQLSLSRILSILIASTGLILISCGTDWKKAIKYGEAPRDDFREVVSTEEINGLIFLPVHIKGKVYNFLFDTGAPTAISKELFAEMDNEVVADGRITDSDKNTDAVKFVRVDSLKIGTVAFTNQTALVIDFKANPILECLKIDGIVGSNLMRFCHWQIDPQKDEINLSSKPFNRPDQTVIIPFHTNEQFDIYANFHVGRAKLSNIKVDYGSTSILTLPDEIFGKLKSLGIINQTVLETGERRGGVLGRPVPIKEEITRSDSVIFAETRFTGTEITEGPSALLGNGFLSNFIVDINWKNRTLGLYATGNSITPIPSFGFRLNIDGGDTIRVQSVIQESEAYSMGLRPGFELIDFGELKFRQSHTFCDYVHFLNDKPERIHVTFLDSIGETKEIEVGLSIFP